MELGALYVYPLKGARGKSLQTTRILELGLEHDRSFVLVDSSGRFVSQRQLPRLALLELSILGSDQIEISFQGQRLSLKGPARGGEEGREGKTDFKASRRMVTVWKDSVEAQDWGDAAADFISQALGQPLRLCRALPEQPRLVKAEASDGHRVPYYFADAFPFLVISQESLDDLNQRLSQKGQAPVPMNRFRPNIVIKGWSPYAEDRKARIRIGAKVELVLARPCSRCLVTTIDQDQGLRGREPLETLASYRHRDGAIYFGQNAYLACGGGELIQHGDSITLLD